MEQLDEMYMGNVLPAPMSPSEASPKDSNPTKVEAICNWPTPTCKQEIQHFLALANYYRRFIKNFSSIAKPLQHLIEKLMCSTGMSCVSVLSMSFADALFPLRVWHTPTFQNVLSWTLMQVM